MIHFELTGKNPLYLQRVFLQFLQYYARVSKFQEGTPPVKQKYSLRWKFIQQFTA